MWRELFSYSLNPEIYFDAENLWTTVGANALPCGRSASPKRATEVRRIGEQRWEWLATHTTESQRIRASSFVLEQSAAMAAALGATVHNLSAPGVFEVPVQLSAMALLADDVGGGIAHRARADAFRAIARRHGVELAARAPYELSQDRRVNEGMLRLPAVLLALSRRSDRFTPELIGADLALRELGMLAPWCFAEKVLVAPEWSRLDMAVAQTSDCLPEGETPLSCALSIVQQLSSHSGVAARIETGIALLLALYEEWERLLHDLTVAHLDSHLSMALLLQSKAREASVYHDCFKLDGRTLREWFSDALTDPLPLLNAIGQNRSLVCKGVPKRSPLATWLLDHGGPMFRVFASDDIKTIHDWIGDLGQADTWFLAESREDVLRRLSPAFLQPRLPVGRGALTLGFVPASVREAYFTLQGRALAPATRAFAADYCEFWLSKAKACVDKTPRSLPSHWQPGLLREWLLDVHARQADRFEAGRGGTVPSREAVIEQSLQLAPLTLIDGAWLQGYTDVALAASGVGANLFKTYWDELGNGKWQHNHPKVYRDVLAAMGKRLPPTGSLEFAFHPDLRSESFRLPVFWLAVGKFPLRYRPEILGLNLAMELSGVGGAYRSAQCFLRYHKLPTTFVDLHNTIDNVSNGHAALAVDAINTCIAAIEGADEAARFWIRVRNGYEALEPISHVCGTLDYFRVATQRSSKATALETLHHAF